MNVSNVFYDGWECFNEVLPGCYWLIGHTGGLWGTQVDQYHISYSSAFV